MTYPLRIGFTGTQVGMTSAQRLTIGGMLTGLGGPFRDGQPPTWGARAHHGDCVGADAEFHQLCRFHGLWIVGHPPLNSSRRAWCQFDAIMPEAEYLERNRAIVDACSVLFAAPREPNEQARSGTWSTVRAARRAGKPHIVIMPNGAAVPDDNYVKWVTG